MELTVDNDIRYVKYVVSKYLRDKPQLEDLREDLEQEGMLGLLKGRDDYKEDKGYDQALWLHYKVQQVVKDYVRNKEVRHFKSPQGEDDNYWDISEGLTPDDLPSSLHKPQESDSIYHYLDRVTLTPRQREVAEVYLSTGCRSETSRILGTSRENVRQVIDRVIEKCKNL